LKVRLKKFDGDMKQAEAVPALDAADECCKAHDLALGKVSR